MALAMRPPTGGGDIRQPFLTMIKEKEKKPAATPMVPGDPSGGGTAPLGVQPPGAGNGVPPVAPPASMPAPVMPAPPAAQGASPFGPGGVMPVLKAAPAAGATTSTGATQPAAPGATQTVGPLGTSAIGLNNIGAVLERQLAQPSAFGMNEVKGIRDYLSGARKAEFDTGMGNINADAARRGAFYSSIPNKGAALLQGQLGQAAAMSDAQLLQLAAESQDRGFQNAITNAMQFARDANTGSTGYAAGLGQIGGVMGQLGQMGAPDINSILGMIGGQGGAGAGGLDPAVAQLLASLLGGNGNRTVTQPAAVAQKPVTYPNVTQPTYDSSGTGA